MARQQLCAELKVVVDPLAITAQVVSMLSNIVPIPEFRTLSPSSGLDGFRKQRFVTHLASSRAWSNRFAFKSMTMSHNVHFAQLIEEMHRIKTLSRCSLKCLESVIGLSSRLSCSSESSSMNKSVVWYHLGEIGLSHPVSELITTVRFSSSISAKVSLISIVAASSLSLAAIIVCCKLCNLSDRDNSSLRNRILRL